MTLIKYRELKRRYELDGAEKTVHHLSEALAKKELKSEDFSLRDLAESLVPDGHHWVRELDPRSGNGKTLLEAEGVDVTAFMSVTSQVVFNKIQESYTQEAFVLCNMLETIPTRFDGEKIPGMSGIESSTAEIKPGMPYPHVGFTADYVETPSTTKQGLIIPVTKEAVFFDRTNLVLSRAAEVGEVLALNKEKRICDVVLGINNTYKWNGQSYNTYNNLATGPYVNLIANNPLQDWDNIALAENQFAQMTDTITKDAILVNADSVLVMPLLNQLANRLFNTASITSDTQTNTLITLQNQFARYKICSSRIAYQQLLKAGGTEVECGLTWFMGNFRKAFAYMENWPITVTQSPLGSEADFNQDILIRFKASERGTPAVINPRYVIKCTN
ncbi:MAG: hypothetical protein ACRC10_01335 [Thermoguttaceae bacterium]